MVNLSLASLPGEHPYSCTAALSLPLAKTPLHGQRVEGSHRHCSGRGAALWTGWHQTQFHSTANRKAEIQHFKLSLQIDRFFLLANITAQRAEAVL